MCKDIFPIIIIENKYSGHQCFNGREIARLRLSKKLVFSQKE